MSRDTAHLLDAYMDGDDLAGQAFYDDLLDKGVTEAAVERLAKILQDARPAPCKVIPQLVAAYQDARTRGVPDPVLLAVNSYSPSNPVLRSINQQPSNWRPTYPVVGWPPLTWWMDRRDAEQLLSVRSGIITAEVISLRPLPPNACYSIGVANMIISVKSFQFREGGARLRLPHKFVSYYSA